MNTTIKVSSEVRDRLKGQTALAHRTLGRHLEHLADLGEREARMAALRTAINTASAQDVASWREETRTWGRIEMSRAEGGEGARGPGDSRRVRGWITDFLDL